MDTLPPIFVMSHDGGDATHGEDDGDDDDDGANTCCASQTLYNVTQSTIMIIC